MEIQIIVMTSNQIHVKPVSVDSASDGGAMVFVIVTYQTRNSFSYQKKMRRELRTFSTHTSCESKSTIILDFRNGLYMSGHKEGPLEAQVY